MKKDYSISFCRMIATFFIVFCHVLQFFGMELAWWFNVGVQMFLFISGYLYANKKIEDPLKFYKKTFTKILLDYYIFVVVFIIGFVIINGRMMDFDSVVGLLTFSSTTYGIRHFWFIPCILLCYVLTPLFARVLDEIEIIQKNLKAVLMIAVMLFVTHVAIFYFGDYFRPAYIVCFVFGMVMKRLEKRRILLILSKTLVIITALVMNGAQIYCQYFINRELSIEFTSYAHVLLGILVVYLLKDCFNLIYKLIKKHKKTKNINKILDLSDKYSYDVYIVHHIFILSNISLYSALGGMIRPTVALLFLTAVSAKTLRDASNYIFNKLSVFYKNESR